VHQSADRCDHCDRGENRADAPANYFTLGLSQFGPDAADFSPDATDFCPGAGDACGQLAPSALQFCPGAGNACGQLAPSPLQFCPGAGDAMAFWSLNAVCADVVQLAVVTLSGGLACRC
jgi:hypothetical protein